MSPQRAMIILPLYFAIIVLLSVSTSSTNWLPSIGNFSSYTCDPNIDCQREIVGAKVPDPEDCHRYYLCVDSNGEPVPSDIPITCQNGEYFDQIEENCTPEGSAPCNNECYMICNMECQVDLQLVAYPGNCSKFYVCLTGGTMMEMDCPVSNPYFDGKECAANPFMCCDSCVPYCTEVFIEIEDPFDCQSFYICTEIGVPSEDYHGKCPDGEHFNSSINICVAGVTCTPKCVESLTSQLSLPHK